VGTAEERNMNMNTFNNLFPEKRRQEQIKAEEERLTGLFVNVGQAKEKALKDVINSTAFYSVMLHELQITILREGDREAMILYNTMLPTFNGLIRGLVSMLPEDEQNDAAELLEMNIRECYLEG
jgi:hypothetical protein